MERPDTVPACPGCGETVRVQFTIPSDLGWYCLCRACGKVWHMDLIPPDPPPKA